MNPGSPRRRLAAHATVLAVATVATALAATSDAHAYVEMGSTGLPLDQQNLLFGSAIAGSVAADTAVKNAVVASRNAALDSERLTGRPFTGIVLPAPADAAVPVHLRPTPALPDGCPAAIRHSYDRRDPMMRRPWISPDEVVLCVLDDEVTTTGARPLARREIRLPDPRAVWDAVNALPIADVSPRAVAPAPVSLFPYPDRQVLVQFRNGGHVTAQVDYQQHRGSDGGELAAARVEADLMDFDGAPLIPLVRGFVPPEG